MFNLDRANGIIRKYHSQFARIFTLSASLTRFQVRNRFRCEFGSRQIQFRSQRFEIATNDGIRLDPHWPKSSLLGPKQQRQDQDILTEKGEIPLSCSFLRILGREGGASTIYTEQMDAEGLGRKLLLTPVVTPTDPLKRRPFVLGQHLTKC